MISSKKFNILQLGGCLQNDTNEDNERRTIRYYMTASYGENRIEQYRLEDREQKAYNSWMKE